MKDPHQNLKDCGAGSAPAWRADATVRKQMSGPAASVHPKSSGAGTNVLKACFGVGSFSGTHGSRAVGTHTLSQVFATVVLAAPLA